MCFRVILHLFNYVFSPCIIYFLDHESEALLLPYCELSFLKGPSLNCEFSCDDVPVSVIGRFRKSLQFEKILTRLVSFLTPSSFGFKLPLLQIPPPFVVRNNNSAIQESLFVENAINELINLECTIL